MSSTAITALHSAFSDAFNALGQNREHDRNVVVASWPSVPVEVIRAAGFTTVFARGSAAATPAADAVLEAGVFPNRIHQLVQAALTGRLSHVAAIVLPRTSDPDNKAYLYLQELRRRGKIQALPPVLLFDLLQSEGPEIPAYNTARVQELLLELARIRGLLVTADALREQIELANGARAAARRLAALRREPPRVAGSEVLPLLGARWTLPAERYTALAQEAWRVLAVRPPLAGPRVLLAGSPVDSTALHLTIESLHATVVDEISPFGSDGAAGDIHAAADPCAALAAWYGSHSITARAPVAMLARRLEDSLTDIHAAVFLLPADDARFGWDLPRARAILQARGIAHAVVNSDPEGALSAADRERLRAALAPAAGTQAVRHG